MGFSKNNGIAVLELILYVPSLIASIFVCARHGFSRNSGWIFTLILCLVRIIGACCELATITSSSTGLYEAVLILESVGLSPLLLATLGLLSRCADSVIVTSGKGVFSAIHFRALQLLVTIGLILSIVGGTSSISPQGVYTPQTTSKAGVMLYLVALIGLSLIAVVVAMKLSMGPKDDKRIAWVAILALPFIAVRLIYSIISVFSHNSNFNPATGSVITHVFMAIMEEWIVVVMFIVVGWMTQALPPGTKGPIESRTKNGRGAHSGRGRRQGPIMALVSAGIERTQQRRQEGELVNNNGSAV